MVTTVAVDPGCEAMGWAIFHDHELVHCGLARGKSWYDTARDLPTVVKHVDLLVVEHPQHYPKSPVDPNTLIKLGFNLGAAAVHFRPVKIVTPTPREWKGQTPKDIHNARVLRKLNDLERERFRGVTIVSLQHNVLDAIGLGLWSLGRL